MATKRHSWPTDGCGPRANCSSNDSGHRHFKKAPRPVPEGQKNRSPEWRAIPSSVAKSAVEIPTPAARRGEPAVA